jgi:hypothetical protein
VVGLLAPEGELVIAQLRLTVPVNEFAGVTEIVEVALAPGLTEMLPLLESVKFPLELVEVVGLCQKPPHPVTRQPAMRGVVNSKTRAHLPRFIATPQISLQNVCL